MSTGRKENVLGGGALLCCEMGSTLSVAAVGAGGWMEESIREGCFYFMFNFLQTELSLLLHPQPPRFFWGEGH